MAHSRLHPLLRWARKPATVPGPDFGDHGTAFGLDLSLTPEPAQPPPEPATSRAAADTGVPGEPSSLWRRVGRRRPSRDR
jgi:hypothetical protein